jgi:hypothetical protein
LGISCSKREKDFYELTPTVPFWSKMNLSYDQADSQDWRTKHTDWSGDGQVGSHKEQTIDYIKRGSGASEEIPGPTRSANFYYRVFGLKALRKTLQNLCDNHLYCGGEGGPEIAVTVAAPSDFNKREDLVTAEEALVLMLVVAFDDMSGHDNAKTGSTEGLSDRVVSFAVPVFFHDKGETKPKKPNALVPLFTFVGEDWNFLTEHEVYGRLAFKSILESPPDTWLGWEGGWSRGRRNLLTVKTILFPTLGKKGAASPRPIIKIFSKEKQTADVSKSLSDFYLESLGIGQENYDYISLKQVRDSIQVDRAPYQAIVSVPRTLDGKREPHNSQLDIELEVYGYDDQGLDVAKTMGLVNEKHTILKPTSGGGENVYKVPAKPGIGIMGRMEEKTAKILRSRVGKEWE